MNQLEQTITTLEVAEMMAVQHFEILKKLEGAKDRKGIIKTLADNQMSVSDYFKESTYKDTSGKSNKCYLITKLGCDFLANKFTGEKGILFTAKYVKHFREMESIISEQQPPIAELSPQLQLLINLELEQKKQNEKIDKIDSKVDSIKEIVALNPNDWRKTTSNMISKMALHMGGYEHIRDIREESYQLLDERFAVSLATRLTNKRRRMADEGVCKSKRDKLSKLDVIADDKKLIEGYTLIIKEMAIRYGVAA